MSILRFVWEWVHQRWQRLVGLVILTGFLNTVLLVAGVAFKSQILLALAALCFSALSILLVIRLTVFGAGLNKASQGLVWSLRTFFMVDINEVIKSSEVHGFLQQVWSIIAWLTILEIVLAAFYPSWTSVGSIILVFAIALFGAAVVNGWGVDTSWVRQWSIRFAVVAFVLILGKLLWPDLNMRSVSNTWKSVTATISQRSENVRLKQSFASQAKRLKEAEEQLVKSSGQAAQNTAAVVIDSAAVRKPAESGKGLFDKDYWKAKEELEAWRTEVNSLK